MKTIKIEIQEDNSISIKGTNINTVELISFLEVAKYTVLTEGFDHKIIRLPKKELKG